MSVKLTITELPAVLFSPSRLNPHPSPLTPQVANEAESARPNLTFLQLDITANDPDGWENPEGVPTVHLYPALADGSKSRGADEFVPYHGEPDVASLEGFLAKNAPLWGTGKAAGKSEL